MTRRIWTTLCVSTALFSGTALGAEVHDAPAAEALFVAGRAAAREGDYGTACLDFEESYRLDPAVGTLLNWADAEERLGRLAAAWQHFKRAADSLEHDDERYELASSKRRELEERLPKLTLSARGELPDGVRVRRDGTQLSSASFGLPLPVDPGRHITIVSAPGYVSRVYDVVVRPGEAAELVIEPLSQAPRAPAGLLEDRRSAAHGSSRIEPLRLAGWSAIGAGGAALIVAGVAALRYDAALGSIDDHCADRKCDEVGLREVGSARTLRDVAIVSSLIGVSLIAGGVTLMLVPLKNSGESTPARMAVAASFRGTF